jgi:hypothetical protein
MHLDSNVPSAGAGGAAASASVSTQWVDAMQREGHPSGTPSGREHRQREGEEEWNGGHPHIDDHHDFNPAPPSVPPLVSTPVPPLQIAAPVTSLFEHPNDTAFDDAVKNSLPVRGVLALGVLQLPVGMGCSSPMPLPYPATTTMPRGNFRLSGHGLQTTLQKELSVAMTYNVGAKQHLAFTLNGVSAASIPLPAPDHYIGPTYAAAAIKKIVHGALVRGTFDVFIGNELSKTVGAAKYQVRWPKH